MLKPADELRKYLKSKFIQFDSKKEVNKLIDTMLNVYNYPISVSSDFLTFRKSLEEANDYDLFILLSAVNNNIINQFFTEKEIEYYSETKLENVKFNGDLGFDVIEITEDQWIGKITAQELISFKESQIINYNENTQRTMRHMVMGNNEYYQIFLNSAAVNSIENLLESNLYIPSTITLNIPEEVEVRYNTKKHRLELSNVKYLDIIDGYHRYIAISKCIYHDKEFDYPMELRLVKYDLNKANQFIYQEDQKTRMRKIDSDAHNQYDESNQIVKKLNESSNMAGLIVMKDGIIDPAVLGNLINKTFFDKKMSKTTKAIKKIEIQKRLLEALNGIVEVNPDYLVKKWTREQILAFIICSSKYDNPKTINEKMENISKEIQKVNIYTISKKKIDQYIDEI